MDVQEAINSKDYLTEEIRKFENGRGLYTYKVKNYAYDTKKILERENRIMNNSIVVKHMEEGSEAQKWQKTVASAVEEIVPLCDEILKYRCFQESELHDMTRYCTNVHSGANYYDFLKLVRMINTWFDVTTEEKAPNKIAWGWEKCREKDNPQAYLYGCVRNYLIRNGEFNKKEFNDIWFGRF